MKKILLLIFVATLFLCACDDRKADKPKMEITTNKDFVFNTDLNSDYVVEFTVQLTGNTSQNQKMYITYNNEYGTVYGASGINNKMVYTNNDGLATFSFVPNIELSLLPMVIPINVKMDKYPSVTKTASFKMYSVPKAELISAPNSASNNQFVTVKFKIGESEKIDNLEVLFEANQGSFVNSIVKTNDQGIAEAVLNTEDATDYISVKAELVRIESVTKSAIIQIR